MTTTKFVGFSKIEQELTAREFLKIVSKRPETIRRSRFIIPKIGSGQKAKFIVEFENGSK